MRLKIILLAVILLIVPFVNAEFIIVNSDNWIDAYSGSLYAELKQAEHRFLISERHSSLIIPLLDKNKEITVIESDRVPYIINYADTLRRKGFAAQEIKGGGKNLNLELARRSGVNSFILVDPSYGYDAISAAPYAILTSSFVVFADKYSINDVLSLLREKNAGKILLYGFLDQEVIDAVKRSYRPELITDGSRYDNNIELVKRYLQLSPAKQVTLSNGEILEAGILWSKQPVLFIGKQVVPESLINFLKISGITHGVLIGNELTQPAKQLKDMTSMIIFIKFAQGMPQQGDEAAKIQGLDFMYLPVFEPRIDLLGVRYNIAAKTIDVALQNPKDLRTYIKTTITPLSDNARLRALGDEDVRIIDADDRVAVSYSVDLTQEIAERKQLTASIYSLYGEAHNFLDRELTGIVPINIMDTDDLCEIRIKKVMFEKETQRIAVTAANTGPVNCHADAQVIDLIINDEPRTISLDEPAVIEKGQEAELRIKQRMDAVDLEDNRMVYVKIYYGEDELFLVKKTEGTFRLLVEGEKEEGRSSMLYLLLGISGIIIIYLLLRSRRKRK